MKPRLTFAEKALLRTRFRLWPTLRVVLACSVGFVVLLNWVYQRGVDSVSPHPVLIDRPPDIANINGQRWHINPVEFEVTVDGLTDCQERTISYDFTRATRSYAREILWHEIGHAIRCSSPESELYVPHAMPGISAEHKIVYEMGMGISAFVHDNPEFMKWAEDWKDK